MVRKMLKEPQVLEATAWSHSTLWQKIKDGKFPPPVKIDPDGRAVAWVADQVAAIQQAAIERQAVRGPSAAPAHSRVREPA